MKQERISNYELTKHRTAKLFLDYDQEKMIRKFNLEHDEQYLYLVFFNRKYRIDRMTGLCEWAANNVMWIEAGFESAMTLYDLLGYSKDDCHLAGTFSPVHNLNGMERVSSQPAGNMFEKTEKILGKHESELDEAVRSLGGIPDGKGDVSYRLKVFPFMDCIFEFWFEDDEFPPQMMILWDRNILQYIHYETVYYAAIQLQNQLIELVGEAPKVRVL